MPSKPLTEVLAAVHHESMVEAGQADQLVPWDRLKKEEQARACFHMAEVVRTMNVFGLEVRLVDGRVGLFRIPSPKPTNRPPPMAHSPLDPTGIFPEQQKFPGYTGIPCGECQSPNTVRTGACLKCHSCFAETECG